MLIKLENVAKRFNYSTLFQGITVNINPSEKWLFKGLNGSGKSTLLQLVAGLSLPNEGKISYIQNQKAVELEAWHKHYTIAAPYIGLLEEFSAEELLEQHFTFKPLHEGASVVSVLKEINLYKKKSHRVSSFSSGMKQRLKLAMAIASASPILFLDEPLTNLDEPGTELYKALIEKYASNKTVIVCSNQIEAEYFFCTKTLDVMEYKKKA